MALKGKRKRTSSSQSEKKRRRRAVSDSEEEQEQHHEQEEEEQKHGEEEQDNDGEDEILDFSQSASQVNIESVEYDQPNGRKPVNKPAQIEKFTAQTEENLTNLLVRYLLYKGSAKEPIRFAHISRDVYPTYQGISRWFFEKAKKRLEDIFGYRVVCADAVRKPNEPAKNDTFFVLNSIDSPQFLLELNRNNSAKYRGFLMIILGLIWCSTGRKCQEVELRKQIHLIDNRIDERPESTKKHPQLGDISSLFKAFVSQKYLTYSKEKKDGIATAYYEFGPRTLLEIGKRNILNFVCKLVNGRPPSQQLLEELEQENHEDNSL